MNEKIEELYAEAKQATKIGRMNAPSGVVAKKFAELIVRECATAFEAEVDTWKEMDPYQGSIKRQGTKAIKQHFGVKE